MSEIPMNDEEGNIVKPIIADVGEEKPEDPLKEEVARLTGSDTAMLASNYAKRPQEIRDHIDATVDSSNRRDSLYHFATEAQALADAAKQLDVEATPLKSRDGILRNGPGSAYDGHRDLLRRSLIIRDRYNDLNRKFIERADQQKDDEGEEKIIRNKM
jgi:hypothetical protein